MTEDSDAVGSMRSSAAQRTAFALDSLKFNMRDKSEPVFRALLVFLTFLRMFSSLFIDHIPQWRQQLEERARSTGIARHCPMRVRTEPGCKVGRPLQLILFMQALLRCLMCKLHPERPVTLPFFSPFPWRRLSCT